ncbi:hypothetical protein ncot_13945 [Nocardioides sp. JQ2195]|uniref:hypothetical protein n=1 Tax=Nocardioides sp. JQ2195 TaxID=2592334 RepID=UPI00143ED6B3|nr:hypothetical protein [Nocardioides sp. JQ2195]QIX27583.1 hypothetical protein ncot_13945 [Nocardioides sp. JQ2195]
MTTPENSQSSHDRPVEIEGVPDEEHMETADAAERVKLDPEEQPNFTERPAEESIADSKLPEDL